MLFDKEPNFILTINFILVAFSAVSHYRNNFLYLNILYNFFSPLLLKSYTTFVLITNTITNANSIPYTI